MELNVAKNPPGVNASALVYAPALLSYGLTNTAGFISIANLMVAANTDLGLSGHNITIANDANRAYQAALQTTLNAANNNLSFLQPTAATCAATFPA
jgi:hypothetical protein